MSRIWGTLVVVVVVATIVSPLQFVPVVEAQAPNPAFQVERFGTIEDSNVVVVDGAATTFRNNLCGRAQQVINGNLTLDQALAGISIRPALMEGEFVQFDYDRNSGAIIGLNEKFPGLVPRLLDEICTRADCEWRNTYGTVSYSDWPSNRTFLDLLLWTTDLYDLTADWWMRSSERLRAGATFTEQWYDASIIMVTEAKDDGKDEFDPWGWTKPFDRAVWIMTIVTVLATSLLHYVLEYLDPRGNPRKIDPIETLWQYATAYAGQFEFDPQTTPARLVTFSIAFWGLLMVATYTANLASFLVIKNNPLGHIQTVQDAVAVGKRMCVWRASQTDTSITTAFPDYAHTSGLLKRTSQRGVYEGLKDGTCEIGLTEATSWEIFSADAEINGDCKLEQIGGIFQPMPASFGVKGDAGTYCTTLLRDVFDYHLHNMAIDGDIEKLWEEHKEETGTVDCTIATTDETGARRRRAQELLQTPFSSSSSWQPSRGRMDGQNPLQRQRSLKTTAKAAGGSEGETKLSLTNMGGVFLFHGLLCGVALMIALVPFLWRKFKKQRNKNLSESRQFQIQNSGVLRLERRGSIRAMTGHRHARKVRQLRHSQQEDAIRASATNTIMASDEEVVVMADGDEEAVPIDETSIVVPPMHGGLVEDCDSSSSLPDEDLRIEMNAKIGTVQKQQTELQSQLSRIEEQLAAILTVSQTTGHQP